MDNIQGVQDEKIRLLSQSLGSERIKINADLREFFHRDFGIKADAFYIATTRRELVKIINLCLELDIEYMVLGSGTKTFFKEGKFPGVIIKNRVDGLRIFGVKGKVSREGLGIEEALVEAESGCSLNKLSDFVKKQKLTGFEELENMKGTVGGGILTNQTLRDRLQSLWILGNDGEITESDLSLYEKTDIIISAVFKLKAKKPETIET